MSAEDAYREALEAFVAKMRCAEPALRRLDPQGPVTRALAQLDESLSGVENSSGQATRAAE